MLIVEMMYSELSELTEEEQRRRLQDYTLCNDNICNVDELGAAKEDLPLPGPLSDMIIFYLDAGGYSQRAVLARGQGLC